MALKPTIYKFTIALSDLNRDYYDSLDLTVAQHPSETLERMMARVLAYCLHAQERLTFTKGLSALDEPDIWLRELDDQIGLWIDVGEPAFERMKKATRVCKAVNIYSFNSKSAVWWKQNEQQLQSLPVSIFQFPNDEIKTLASLLKRTMVMSVTVTENTAYFSINQGKSQAECEVSWTILQSAN